MEQNYPYEPREQDSYETGSTNPPKSNGGLVAILLVAVILLVTGLFIGHTAIEQIAAPTPVSTMPGLLALVAALVSIAGKEGMYWYTRFYAKRLDSGALMANAWHHRSDALSSIGALIGILKMIGISKMIFWSLKKLPLYADKMKV